MAKPGGDKEPNAVKWTADSGYGTFSAQCPPEPDLSGEIIFPPSSEPDLSEVVLEGNAASASSSPGVPQASDDFPALETAEETAEEALELVPVAGTPMDFILQSAVPVSEAHNPSSEVCECPTQQGSASPQENIVLQSEEERFAGSAGATQLVGANLDGIQTMECRLANKEIRIDQLEEKLHLTVLQKEKAQLELKEAKKHHRKIIEIKNDEIIQLKDEVEGYKVQVAKLEKTNYLQKLTLEEKIRLLKKELDDKEAEQKNEKLILENKIMKNQLVISQMETQEQCLRCKLAQANEETAKVKVLLAAELLRKGEEEREKIKDELETSIEIAQTNEKLADDLRIIAESNLERNQEKAEKLSQELERKNSDIKQAQEKEKLANELRRESEVEKDKLIKDIQILTERLDSIASTASIDSNSDIR